jgi:hypothetical protein
MGRLAKSEVLRPDDALDVVLGWLQVYDQARKAGSTREQAAVIADGEMDFSEDATQ